MNVQPGAPRNVTPPPRLGVLGGMGPAATADFLAKLVRATPAKRDWDHIPVVVRSFPQIPDRSDAILLAGESPLPALAEGVRWLAASDVDAIAIACNTAHHWYEELQQGVGVPILHIADAVNEALQRDDNAVGPIALFATEGTLRARIFEQRLNSRFELLPSEPKDIWQIMAAVRAAKASRLDLADQLLRDATARNAARGARRIVLACTELPILPSAANTSLYLDATDALARFCVARLNLPRSTV
jgi:aspartate racemase